MFHPEIFSVQCDEYQSNRPANRLIKTTLLLVSKVSKNPKNQRLARELSFVFEEIPVSNDIQNDFKQVRTDRTMDYYLSVLSWCKLLLNGMGPTASSGKFNTLSLLYPMERIFEDYVTKCLQSNISNYFGNGSVLKSQSTIHSLVNNHHGKQIFQMRPDLLILKDKKISCVLDVKWKIINSSDRKNKYGISQADMYQLYAYGKKYMAGTERKHVILIYPKSKFFQSPLAPFEYEDDFILEVLPFDIQNGMLIQ